MTRPRPRWSLAAAATLLAVATAALIYACQERPTEPDLLDASNAANKKHLTILATGSMASGVVTSSRGGISCTITYTGTTVTLTGTCGKDYKTNMVLTLTAAPSGGGTAIWTGCDGAVTENPLACQVTMNAARTVTIKFSQPAGSFALDVQGGAGGSGSVQSSPSGITCSITAGTAGASGCSFAYASGMSVTLTATAAAGSYLKAWAGAGCEASGNGVGQGSGACTLTMSQIQSVVVSFDTDAAESLVGAWGAPLSWPAVAIHAQVLPNGWVMTFGRMDHNPVLWDPQGGFGSATRPADFFCSGHAFLPDGRLLVTGGHSGVDNLGTKTAYLYDFATNTWTRGPDMQNGRWYPSTTTLANGQLLTMSGGDTAQMRNLIPEVFQPGGTTGTWRVLSTASKNLPLYPMPFVAPDGRVFVAGPTQATYFLTPSGTGGWVNGPTRATGSRDYGSAVMYDAGKILMVGGGAPLATAEVIDLNAGSGWRTLSSSTNTTMTMSVARRQSNATLLADGKVLVTGGTNATGFNNPPTDSKVLSAELWDPATEKFTSLSRMTHNRLYHSTALLLPDGRVLSVGSGQPAASGLTDDYTAEIFSPPYLFKADGTPAARPNLDDVPLSIGYGGSITVTTANPTGITKATWIRLSSVTHAFNMNQRMNYLPITARGTGTITLQAPSNANLAPPGHYMLFLVNSSGVPSVAKIIRIN
jgi:WD40 repeat protein